MKFHNIIVAISLYVIGAFSLDSFYIQPIKQGIIECSTDITERCDLSAITTYEDENSTLSLYAVNDKTPKSSVESSILKLNIDQNMSLSFNQYILTPPSTTGKKYEAMTTLPNGTILISTTFNNYQNDPLNNIMIGLEPFNQNKVYLVSTNKPSTKQDFNTSIQSLLLDALNTYTKDRNEFIKIEGLATIGNRILFAIREYGHSYTTRQYATIIIEGSYHYEDNYVVIDNDKPFRVVTDLSEIVKKCTGQNIGISSIDYNAHNHKIYFLTTFEPNDLVNNAKLTTYLWSINVDAKSELDLTSLSIANFLDNSSAKFSYKGEGLTFLTSDTAIMVSDNDGILLGDTNRSNQSIYTLFKLTKYPEKKFIIPNPNSNRPAWTVKQKIQYSK